MSRIRSKDTVAELMLRRELWARGFRYRLHAKGVPGKPDIVFKGARVAVFVDGDWWHGRVLAEEGEGALRKVLRTSRQDWWVSKLSGNVARDQRVTAELESLGWLVIRVWESDIKRALGDVADRVESALIDAGVKQSRASVAPKPPLADKSEGNG